MADSIVRPEGAAFSDFWLHRVQNEKSRASFLGIAEYPYSSTSSEQPVIMTLNFTIKQNAYNGVHQITIIDSKAVGEGCVEIPMGDSQAGNITVSGGHAERMDPVVTWPAVNEITYGQTFGEAISDGTGEGVFTIEDADMVPAANEEPYIKIVTFTPADTENYNTLTHIAEVTVTEGIQNIQGQTEGVLLSIPAAPAVTADDIMNTIIGLNISIMEYAISEDNGVTYSAYSSAASPSLGGSKMVKVRIRKSGLTPAGADTILMFTPNYGDVSADGIINISDVIMTAEIFDDKPGYTPQQILRANVSDRSDMTVDITDVYLIAMRCVGDTTMFPIESPVSIDSISYTTDHLNTYNTPVLAVTISRTDGSVNAKTYYAKVECRGDDSDWRELYRGAVTIPNHQTSAFARLTFNDKFNLGGYKYTRVILYDDSGYSGIIMAGKQKDSFNFVEQYEVTYSQPTKEIRDGVEKNHYYIFDDHPEHIRRCDILDDWELNPTALMHSESLTPGIYTVFSTHGKSLGYLSRPELLIGDADIYFDSVFYNYGSSSGSVKINKLGYRSFGTAGPEGDPNWTYAGNAWTDYKDYVLDGYTYENIKHIGANQDSYKHNNTLYGGAVWLTDILEEKYPSNPDMYNTRISQGGYSSGYSYLMMEFEVTGGTVNFATVAYKDQNAGKANFIDWNNTGSVKSTYETLETVKGKSDTTMTVEANRMYYYIDDSMTETDIKLPFTISNEFYNNRKVNVFTTNCSPISFNNHYQIPGTSVVACKYNGEGLVRDPNNGEQTQSLGSGDWMFDTVHTQNITDKDFDSETATETSVVAPYKNRKFNSEWLKQLAIPEDYIYIDQGGWNDPRVLKRENTFNNMTTVSGPRSELIVDGTAQNINPGYCITYEYTISIYNASSSIKHFSYMFQGQLHQIEWECNGEEGHRSINQGDGVYEPSLGPEQVFYVDLPRNVETTIVVRETMMNGSNPFAHHAYIIDADQSHINNVYWDPEKTSLRSAMYDEDIYNIWDVRFSPKQN